MSSPRWQCDSTPSGNAPRLRLEDLRGGRVRYLDALELETIIWLPEERLTGLLDPSHSRWRGEVSGAGFVRRADISDMSNAKPGTSPV